MALEMWFGNIDLVLDFSGHHMASGLITVWQRLVALLSYERKIMWYHERTIKSGVKERGVNLS